MANEIYEVWDTESGNILTAYPTEREALDLVRANLHEFGPDAVQRWALVRERSGRSKFLAEGAALIARAESSEDVASIQRTGT